jgi:nicotinamidase-related amidase
MMQGSDIDIVPELKAYAQNVYLKHVYSACTKELLDNLKQSNISETVLVGMETDACILSTAFDLFNAGFQVKILSDLCASAQGKDLHECALRILRRNIGKQNVLSLEEFKPI